MGVKGVQVKINAQKGEIPSEDGVGLERAFELSLDLGRT